MCGKTVPRVQIPVPPPVFHYTIGQRAALVVPVVPDALVAPVVPDALVALDEPAATDVRTALTALTVCAALLFLAKLNLTIQIAYSCGLF